MRVRVMNVRRKMMFSIMMRAKEGIILEVERRMEVRTIAFAKK